MILNRIGDFRLVIGILIIFVEYKAVDYVTVFVTTLLFTHKVYNFLNFDFNLFFIFINIYHNVKEKKLFDLVLCALPIIMTAKIPYLSVLILLINKFKASAICYRSNTESNLSNSVLARDPNN